MSEPKKKNRPVFDLSILDKPESSAASPLVDQSDSRPKEQINVILEVSIEALEEDLTQPRTEFEEEELQNLAADIANRGVRQPLTVKPAGELGHYKIINGARRYRASQMAGLKNIPVIVEKDERYHGSYDQLLDNTKRADLSALEIAQFIASRKELGESNKEISAKLSENESYITFHLALIDASSIIIDAYKEGRISDVRAIYKLTKLEKSNPEVVAELLGGDAEIITRKMVEEIQSPNKSREPHSPSGEPDNVSPHSSSADPQGSVGEDFFSEEENVKVQKLPYHNPQLDEGESSDGRMRDPSKIKKPLLLGEINSRPLKVLLSRAPTVPGLIHIQWEDTMEEEELDMGPIKLTLLAEMRLQEKQ